MKIRISIFVVAVLLICQAVKARPVEGVTPVCAGVDDSVGIAAAGAVAGDGWIVITRGQVCAVGTMTLPNLRVEKGGLLKPLSTDVVVEQLDAGPYQTFTNGLAGQGRVLLPGTFSVFPQWWGGVPEATVDSTAAIAAAEAAAAGRELYLSSGTWINSTRLTITNHNLTIRGAGWSTIWRAKDGGVSPVQIAAANKHRLTIKDIKFVGNGVNPTTPGSADPAIYLQTCRDVLFDRIYMTGFQGIGLAIANTSVNVKVTRSTFRAMGQDQKGLAPVAGVAAIWSSFGSSRVQVVDNHFDDCRFGGVFLLCSHSLVGGNTFNHIGEAAIYSEYTDPSTVGVTGNNRILGNLIKDVYKVDISGTCIESSANDTVISSNRIDRCEGNGIGVSAASNVVVTSNVVSNVNYKDGAPGTLNGAGILVMNIPNALNPSKGSNIVVTNNVVFDDSTPPTSKYGLSISSWPTLTVFTNSKFANNSISHCQTNLFVQPGVLDHPTNVLAGNSIQLELQTTDH